MLDGVIRTTKMFLVQQGKSKQRIKWFSNALELVPHLGVTFDLAFIDGDKRKYIDYYEMVLSIFPQVGISLPTIHCGMVMCWNNLVVRIRRPLASKHSMTPL